MDLSSVPQAQMLVGIWSADSVARMLEGIQSARWQYRESRHQ